MNVPGGVCTPPETDVWPRVLCRVEGGRGVICGHPSMCATSLEEVRGSPLPPPLYDKGHLPVVGSPPAQVLRLCVGYAEEDQDDEDNCMCGVRYDL